jgi:hypothetical protein
MIDVTSEEILSLSQAAAELPRLRRGRKVALSTLHRWAKGGCRGIRLETISIGSTACTSRQALARFFEAVTKRSASGHTGSGPHSPEPAQRTSAQCRRAAECAGNQLASMGA